MSGGKAPQTGTNWMDVQRDQEQRAYEEKLRIAADEKAAQQKTANVEARNRSATQGINDARTRAYTTLRQRGIDPANFGGVIEQTLQNTLNGIGEEDTKAGSYFTDSLFDEAFGRVRDDRRAAYTNNASKVWKPGFENDYFKSDADDSFINSILGQQKDQATQYVNRARSRGQLDETGFNAALGKIGEMEQTGRSTANKLGDAVLQGNRTRLSDIANNAKAAAGSYELGQGDFDLGTYGNQFNDKLGAMNSSLQGDIYGALEGQNFFDVGDIISRGGAVQGAVNAPTERADQIAAREKLRASQRGTSSDAGGGVF